MKHLNEQEKAVITKTLGKIETQLEENKYGTGVFIDGQINAIAELNKTNVLQTLLNVIYNEDEVPTIKEIYDLVGSTQGIQPHIVPHIFKNRCKELLIKELLTLSIK